MLATNLKLREATDILSQLCWQQNYYLATDILSRLGSQKITIKSRNRLQPSRSNPGKQN